MTTKTGAKQMAMETEVGNITAFDNANGQGVLVTVEFKDYDLRH